MEENKIFVIGAGNGEVDLLIDKIKSGMAKICSAHGKNLVFKPGEKLFKDNQYMFRTCIPKEFQGLSYLYNTVSGEEITVEEGGYVVALCPKGSADELIGLGFSAMAFDEDVVGFAFPGTLMEDRARYYCKLCAEGEVTPQMDEWCIFLFRRLPENEYYTHNWVAFPGRLVCDEAELLQYSCITRRWQGIPSVEKNQRGRCFVSFGSGGTAEPDVGNYVVYCYSDDKVNWRDFLVIIHPCDDSRVFDASLWLDPLGKLWMFWSQSCEKEDGAMGVWCIRIDDPQAPDEQLRAQLKSAIPKRIANGIKLNKPTVLSDGTWMFAALNPGLEDYDYIYVSNDHGESWKLRSEALITGCKHADEPMIVERKDLSLAIYVRSTDGTGIRVAYSYDKGYTWSESRDARLGGPSSRFHIRKLPNGEILLINHFHFVGRNNLSALISEDDGETWNYSLLLDGRRSVSYPDVTVDRKGTMTVVWDRERGTSGEILLAEITEEDIKQGGELLSDNIRIVSRLTK